MTRERKTMRRFMLYVITAGVLSIFAASQAFAVLLDRKEGCSANMTCNGTGSGGGTTVPMQCDDCFGPGWITWTKAYVNCSGGTTYNDDCDDQTWDLPWGYVYCDVPAGQKTFQDGASVSTYGTISTGSGWNCSCGPGPTKHSCQFDVTVHREYDADKTSNWSTEKVILAIRSSPVLMQSAGDVRTYTASGSTTTTTGWTFSFTGGAKGEAVEAAVGASYSYSESDTQTFGSSISHTVEASEEGDYIGGFASQVRQSCDVEWFKWGCSGKISGPNTGKVYRVTGAASPDYRTGATQGAVTDQETNANILEGGIITGS